MYSSALKKYGEYLEIVQDELEEDIKDIISDDSNTETDKLSLIKSRIGQGKFRDNLFTQWNGCAVTGYKTSNFLIASHIKPWRVSDNFERLDRYNGLLLLPNFDKAFDNGFISFEKSGEIMISDILERPDYLGIHNDMKVNLEEPHQKYLEFHRDMVFIDTCYKF